MDRGSDQDYAQFKGLIFRLTGIDLSLYKEEQMRRRLNTLRLKRGFSSFTAYFQGMKTDSRLLEEFLSRMTINVTEFFRNRPRWAVLEELMKEMAQTKSRISVWSAACSTGEEPYSLSILLRRYFPSGQFSITATDIDQEVLNKAKEGKYLEQAVAPLVPMERNEFFKKQGLFYSVAPILQKEIHFQKHDLLHDPVPGSFDLVVCRNVLIYFTDEGKKIIYRKIGQSLNDRGILFVGSTEQIFHPENYGLESVETFFYRKGNNNH